MPLAVISGRVTDDAGVPVVEASVRAQQYRGGRWVGAATATTNDLGVYRLYGLQPGSYYVSAGPDLSSGNAEFVTGESATDYATTFYPQARDAASGMAVTLDAGYTATGIDIQLAKIIANNPAGFLPVAELSPSGEVGKEGLPNAPVSLPSNGVANSSASRGAVEGWVVNELTGEPDHCEEQENRGPIATESWHEASKVRVCALPSPGPANRCSRIAHNARSARCQITVIRSRGRLCCAQNKCEVVTLTYAGKRREKRVD
jgi:Carboxypeptidase regulatory-like domain